MDKNVSCTTIYNKIVVGILIKLLNYIKPHKPLFIEAIKPNLLLVICSFKHLSEIALGNTRQISNNGYTIYPFSSTSVAFILV